MTSVLLISGSLRDDSINSAVIRTVVPLLDHDVESNIYPDLGSLPHFNPDVEAAQPPDIVLKLRQAIEASDAVLFCTPEYAGSLPGSFKNLLDWTVGGNEIVGMPTAWLNASSNATEAIGAHETLRTVLNYTGADIVEEACRHIPVARADIGQTGEVETASRRDEIRAAVRALVAYSREQER